VVNIAKKYIRCGIPMIDLISEGNIGLIYAAERFKTSKQCRFSTYATFWIRHTICRAITERNTLIRIPAYMKKILMDCKKKHEDLMKRLGHWPTLYETVNEMSLKKSREGIVKEALITNRAMESVQSLQSIDHHENIVDGRESKEHDHLIINNQVEWLMKMLHDVEPKRAYIIKLRYGLEGQQALTLQEIAHKLNLTKERIRQIEKETLKMLKDCLQKNGCQGE
jgi:RNA polymerase sigma factor (sigma-70 family)